MPGPCSNPAGAYSWDELNEIVCDSHFNCDMSKKHQHDYITYREWLARRNKLRTGKTR